jgi:hypothetical protein
MKYREWLSIRGYYCISIVPETRMHIWKSIVPETRIHTCLGRIKKKNDGRYEWFRWSDKNNFHPLWNNKKRNSQGVCITKKEAVAELLNGWPEEIRKTSSLYEI